MTMNFLVAAANPRSNTLDREPAHRVRVLRLSVALAAFAAASYVLIGQHVLAVGNLQTAEQPATIIYVAAGSYLLGGLLILLRRRWLWMIGAAINALVMLFFVAVYLDRPAVLFSPGGLVSKAAQLLLEVGLIYLIITDWRRTRQRPDKGAEL
jgi:hypothetical protein